MKKSLHGYPQVLAKRRTLWLYWIGCFAVSILCLFVIKENELGGKLFLRILGIVFGLGGVGLLIPGKTIVDTTNHVVRRELLLSDGF